jgi:hypothetical protein
MRSCRAGYNTNTKSLKRIASCDLAGKLCVSGQILRLQASRPYYVATCRYGEAVFRADGPCALEIDSALFVYDQISRLVCDSCQKQDNCRVRWPASPT